MSENSRCFPVNFAKFLRTTFRTEHLRWLLMDEQSCKYSLTCMPKCGVKTMRCCYISPFSKVFWRNILIIELRFLYCIVICNFFACIKEYIMSCYDASWETFFTPKLDTALTVPFLYPADP